MFHSERILWYIYIYTNERAKTIKTIKRIKKSSKILANEKKLIIG